MKHNVKLGVVCLARTTFDYSEAERIYKGIREDLSTIEDVKFKFVEELIIEIQDARDAAQRLSLEGIDGLVVISGTFHLGHLVLELDKVLNRPILLWGLKELPYNGGKIRLNSVCGVNLNASNLYKSGNRNYYAIVGEKIDENWIDALRIKSAIEKSRIGIAGYRAHGFFNLGIDELSSFRKLGVLIDHFELSDIYNTEVAETEALMIQEELKTIFRTNGISSEQLRKVAELSARFKSFMDTNRLNALAVRCWPEFARDFGVAPCAAMSYLQSKGYLMGCEGDVEGTISMIAHRALGEPAPFLADLSQVDLEEDFALMWHCGAAPCSLWDGVSERCLDTYFAGGKGVTADFVMKPGDVMILRIDSAQEKFRVFMERGQGMAMEKLLKGTYLKVRFEHSIQEVLNRVIYSGVAHHVSLAYGDYTRALEIFARIMDIEIIKGQGV